MLLPLFNDFRMAPSDEAAPPELREQLEGIQTCRERRGVDICSACLFYDDCDRVKTYLRWVEMYKTSGRSSEGGSQ